MPTLPLEEPEQEDEVPAWLALARFAESAAAKTIGADRAVTMRMIIALTVLVICATLNPLPVLAVAGGVSGLFLALEIARR